MGLVLALLTGRRQLWYANIADVRLKLFPENYGQASGAMSARRLTTKNMYLPAILQWHVNSAAGKLNAFPENYGQASGAMFVRRRITKNMN
jgi:hypothetical protein